MNQQLDQKVQRARVKESERKLRLRVLKIIAGDGEVKCSNCGCDDLRILEINHQGGGGYRDRKGVNFDHRRIQRDISHGRRGVGGLNILCRVCNHAEFVSRKYRVKFNVVYGGRVDH